jgi:hypothetical protein
VDWGGPRIIAIHIPEEIDWTNQILRKEIGKAVYKEFQKYEREYKNVNAVVFSSDRIPQQIKNVTSTDIPCLMFLNLGNTKY